MMNAKQVQELVNGMTLVQYLKFSSIKIQQQIALTATFITGSIVTLNIGNILAILFLFLSTAMLAFTSIALKKYLKEAAEENAEKTN